GLLHACAPASGVFVCAVADLKRLHQEQVAAIEGRRQMPGIFWAAVRVRKIVLGAKEVVEEVSVHEGAEAKLVDEVYGAILALASNDLEVVTGFVEEDAVDVHRLPKADAIFDLFGLERLVVAERNVTVQLGRPSFATNGTDDLD